MVMYAGGTGNQSDGQVYYDAQRGEYYMLSGGLYAPAFGQLRQPTKTYLGSLNSNQQGAIPSGGGALSAQYTPNPVTAAQLNGSYSAASETPAWMADAYARKMSSMGGNGNMPGQFFRPAPAAPQYQPNQNTATGGLPAPMQSALLNTINGLRNVKSPIGGKTSPGRAVAPTSGTSSPIMINGRNASGFR